MTSVVVTQDREDIGRAITEAFRHIDIAASVRGKIVAVKPNETWSTRDDTSAVTQGDTLRAVLRHVKQFGPRELVVTGGAGAAETEDVFRHSGMMDAVRDEGAAFVDHNRPPFTEVRLEYASDRDVSGPQRSVMVSSRVLDYETLIVVSQLKLHRTATVTLALKNIAMSFPAADYYGHPRSTERHQNAFFDDMHSFIAAMAKRFPIDLAITVGHPAMIATGPTGGIPVETGIVVASTDAVAADVVGARLLGFEVQGVRHLWEAGRLGIGETDMDAMEFPAMSFEEAAMAFTEAAYGKAVTLSGA
ncbi:MAG TPA: DUF362 domain-containing protein [Gemmatimonadaceae bacterium]|nr:DUF362 domain-containing protein [Gemmatimonadaceae bacterium]